MNNTQFRNLVGNQKNESSESSQNAFKKPTLGSRARPSVPMTPRSLSGQNYSNDFARQVAAHKRESNGEPPTKKFRSSAAPKGTKLASGYNDRSSERRGHDAGGDQDDKFKRLKALEEMFKLQQIDQETFDKLQDELGVGGDISSAHMVKGLDWKLLERVRRGEDINKTPAEEPTESGNEIDVEDELEKALEKDVKPIVKEQTQPGAEEEIASQPTTRDEILRRLKESRLSAAARDQQAIEAAPKLGERFKSFGSAPPKAGKEKFTETVNGRRREVLIVTDKDGTTKRKTRWIDPEVATTEHTEQAAWGGDVSTDILARQKAFEEEQKRKAAEEEEEADGEIFPDAGEYDPLADIGSDESDQADDEKDSQQQGQSSTAPAEVVHGGEKQPQPQNQNQPRNYFSTGTTTAAPLEDESASRFTQDPNILAALKRAAQLRQHEQSSNSQPDTNRDSVDPEQESKRRAFLAKLKARDQQDALDMDMGFGDVRMGDEDEDEDGGGEPLANWGDEDDGKQGGGRKHDGNNRKRGPKKRKGDKNNVQDVLGVLQGRQKKA